MVGGLVISGSLLVVYYFLNETLFEGILQPQFPGLAIFFLVQSLPIGWMLSEGEKDRSRLPMYALGSISFRFVSGILFLVVFFIIEIENPTALVIQFMGVYLLYLAFELFVVLSNLRRNSGDNLPTNE